jgi:hypothetical protein
VVEPTGELDAKGSGHALSLAGRCWNTRPDKHLADPARGPTVKVDEST